MNIRIDTLGFGLYTEPSHFPSNERKRTSCSSRFDSDDRERRLRKTRECLRRRAKLTRRCLREV